MKRTSILRAGLAGTIGLLASFAAAAQIDPYVQALRSAKDPSAAIAAFSGGLAVDARSVELHEAYLRRMVNFGMADATSLQAKTLVELDADNGLGWAVIAFVNAQRGQIEQSISAMVKAVRKLPDDRFVLYTAGQLLAWYDHAPGPLAITQAARNTLEEFRRDLSGSKAFAAGYQATRDALVEQQADEREEKGDDAPAERLEESLGSYRYYYRDYSSGPAYEPVYSYGLIINGYYGGRYPYAIFGGRRLHHRFGRLRHRYRRALAHDHHDGHDRPSRSRGSRHAKLGAHRTESRIRAPAAPKTKPPQRGRSLRNRQTRPRLRALRPSRQARRRLGVRRLSVRLPGADRSSPRSRGGRFRSGGRSWGSRSVRGSSARGRSGGSGRSGGGRHR